jgi:hypothetical protein
VATARLRVPPPDPRAVNTTLPQALGEIVTRAMARDPAKRFSSAEAMRSALLAWLADADAPPLAVPAALDGPQPAEASDTSVSQHVLVPAPASIGDAQPRRQRLGVGIWPLALVLVALIAGGYLGARLIGGNETPLPEIVVGSPGGEVIADATPTSTPVATSSAAPTSTPTPTPTATLAPETPVPTAVPVSAPTVAPPAPTDAAIALAGPDDAVAAFYSDVVADRFDDAYGLWSDRMKATYPRQENLDNRFDETAAITFDALYVAEESASAATVQANFLETYDSGASRRFIGYWRLVRVNGRWLLDAPTY